MDVLRIIELFILGGILYSLKYIVGHLSNLNQNFENLNNQISELKNEFKNKKQ